MWEGARAVARFLLPLLVVASFLLSLDAAAADEGGEAAAVQTLFDVSDSLKAAVTAGDEALARELRTTIKGIQVLQPGAGSVSDIRAQSVRVLSPRF